MKIKTVKESTSVASKNDMIKAFRWYGLDKKRIEKVIKENEPGQYFLIETDLGDIRVHVAFDIRDISIEAPPRVMEILAKEGEI
jgi:hypothetical protein